MKEQLDFRGKLNKDDSILPSGDYREAYNILKKATIDGKGGSLKKMRSIGEITEIGSELVNSSVLASCLDENENIFFLSANSSFATIEKLTPEGTLSTILEYNHNSASIDPDIVILGSVLVWNYYGEGVPLSWDINRPIANNPSIEDLTFIKSPPLKIDSSINTGVPKPLFKNTFDFAARYVYDSGEISVLSTWSTVLGEEDQSDLTYGIDGIESIDLTVNGNHPTYANKIEWYARKNEGTWRRIDTTDISSPSSNYTITFTGSLNESLSTESATKNFDSVPIKAKSLEAIKNRIFLANVQDDLGGTKDPITSISLLDAGGWAGTGSNTYNGEEQDSSDKDNPWMYFKDFDFSSGIYPYTVPDPVDSASASVLQRKALVNDSEYLIGIQLLDQYHRTRGVEAYFNFKTGMFTSPSRIESITIEGSEMPSWAKYYQIVYSENLSKDFSIEGFASAIYYEFEDDDGNLFYNDHLSDPDKITRIVIVSDIPYTYQDGDQINLATGWSIGNDSGKWDVQSTEITGVEGNKIFINPSKLDNFGGLQKFTGYRYFEIFSPRLETENVIFKGTPIIRPISEIDDTEYELTGLGEHIYDCTHLKRKISAPTGLYVDDNMSPKSFRLEGCPLNKKGFSTLTPRDEINSYHIDDGVTFVKFDGMHTWSSDQNILLPYIHSGFASSPDITGIQVYSDNFSSDEITLNDYIVSLDLNLSWNLLVSGPYHTLEITLKEWKYNGVTYQGETGSWDIVNSPIDQLNQSYQFRLEKSNDLTSTETYVYGIQVDLSGGTDNRGTVFINQGTALTIQEKSEYYNNTVKSAFESEDYIIVRELNKIRNNDFKWDKPSGKPSIEYDRRDVVINKGKIRWGEKFISNSNNNPISSFFFADQDEVGYESGAINALIRTSKMNEIGTVLLAICTYETSSIYIEERVLESNTGSTQIVASDDVVGSIQTLKGRFGTLHKGSITRYRGRVVWWDDVSKDWVRYSREGLVPLGSTYKMRSEFQSKSGDAVSFYDPFHGMFFMSHKDGTSFAFSDREGFHSVFDFDFDHGGQVVRNKVIAVKSSYAYRSLESGFNSFFGNDVDTSIKIPFRTRTGIEPLSISMRAPQYLDWSRINFVKDFIFEFTVSNENGQETTMPDSYFQFETGLIYGDIMKDENSIGGAIEGISLQGTDHVFELSLTDNTIDDSIEYIDINFDILNGL